MKKVIQVLCLIFTLTFTSHSTSFAQLVEEDMEHNIDVGVGLAYGAEVESLGFTGDIYYVINNNFRVGGAFTYYLPEDVAGASSTWFTIDLNGQYLFYSEESVNIYGLGGLNIAILSVDFDDPQFDDTSETEIGLNLGGGVEYDLDFADLFGELKLAGVGGDADQLVLNAGLRFDI